MLATILLGALLGQAPVPFFEGVPTARVAAPDLLERAVITRAALATAQADRALPDAERRVRVRQAALVAASRYGLVTAAETAFIATIVEEACRPYDHPKAEAPVKVARVFTLRGRQVTLLGVEGPSGFAWTLHEQSAEVQAIYQAPAAQSPPVQTYYYPGAVFAPSPCATGRCPR